MRDMSINDDKKLALLKNVSHVIFVYSFIFPLLTLFGIFPFDLNTIVLLGYFVVSIIVTILLRKYPAHYKNTLWIIIIYSLITSTSAMYFAVDDGFRAIWFFFTIFIAYFIGNTFMGVVSTLLALVIITIYWLTPYSTFGLLTYMTIVMSFSILSLLAYVFEKVQTSNEHRLAIQNDELDVYKNNLEELVYKKTQDISKLNDEIVKTQQDLIYTLATLVDTHSPETGNHIRRVSEYSYLLAKSLGMSDEEAELVKIASTMHDIGKIGIRDSILMKPSILTPEEQIEMRRHTTLGYEMLCTSDRPFFKAASLIALEHHEKYDGSGYPKGLKGEEINIYARITAVADVFDALSTARVYKPAWGDEKILPFFQEQKGKHFDPKIVDLFFDKFYEIKV
ncbi:MAG: HD domain-containing protein, partial [Epsilonproteobacteria bacterium]|nr:HD domain-containing protein [Campylobacterota bacterium]